MKKTFTLIITIFILCTNSAFNQNSNTVVTMGGVNITIPSANNTYKEVGESQRELFNSFVPETNSLLCVFLDTNDYSYLLKGANENVVMETYMLVEFGKQVESMDCSAKDFLEVKDGVVSTLKNDLDAIKAEANKILNEQKENIGDVEVGTPKTLGKIYEINDAFGSLMSIDYKTDTKVKKMLCSVNFLRLKNRLVYIYIYSKFNNIDNVKYINEISKSWAKLLLEQNK